MRLTRSGPYYFYIIDSPTLTLDVVSSSTQELLGIAPDKVTLSKIIDLVHPDDLNFLFRCEDVVAHFLKNHVDPDQMTKYKISYCLRERIGDGTYKLFLLQNITIKASSDGALLKVFGAHTDISHITTENNQRMSLIGLRGEPSYMNLDVFDDGIFDNFSPLDYFQRETISFTKKEIEVIKLLSLGLPTNEIASKLNIAYQTAATHRKNLLRKSSANNTTELVADCIRKGII